MEDRASGPGWRWCSDYLVRNTPRWQPRMWTELSKGQGRADGVGRGPGEPTSATSIWTEVSWERLGGWSCRGGGPGGEGA